MIATETTCTITCDKCGRAIAEGETWYQVSQSVACSVFSGAVTDLQQVSSSLLQLCPDDYPTWAEERARATPTADTIMVELEPGRTVSVPAG